MNAKNRIKSFLVWDDSNVEKYQQLEKLPKGKRLVEPFVGAGSVFLNTDYEAYLLADNNQDIINVFQMLAEYKQEFIKRAKQYFSPVTNTREVYDFYQYAFSEICLSKFSSENRIRRGCVFLYLNHHGVREQSLCHGVGCFDVPYGNDNATCFPEQEMQDFLAKIDCCNVIFLCADFQQTLAMATLGDVVYCDLPPITVTKKTNFYSNRREFSWEDHFRLLKSFYELELRGIPVLFACNNLKNKVLIEKFETMED